MERLVATAFEVATLEAACERTTKRFIELSQLGREIRSGLQQDAEQRRVDLGRVAVAEGESGRHCVVREGQSGA
jgi:hypothetical protein